MIMKTSTIVLSAAAALLVFTAVVNAGETEQTYVPDGWHVELVPDNFNTGAFHLGNNIAGKATDGTWPLLDALCGTVQFGGAPQCNVGNDGPVFDFYDAGQDGTVDFGHFAGCTYDPYSPERGREFFCS